MRRAAQRRGKAGSARGEHAASIASPVRDRGLSPRNEYSSNDLILCHPILSSDPFRAGKDVIAVEDWELPFSCGLALAELFQHGLRRGVCGVLLENALE